MKRQSLTIVSLLVMAVLVLSACSAPTNTPVPPTKAPEPTKAPAPTQAPPTAVPPTKAPEPTATVAPTATPAKLKVIVASDATFPPFESVDEKTKEIVGFDMDLIKAIAGKAGLELEIKNTAWEALLAGISQCQFDVAISGMTITEDRKKAMLFSDPYVKAGQIVIVKKTDTTIKSKDDLKGKKIGAQLETTGAAEVKKIANATLKAYDSYDQAVMDLINGQISAVIADYPVALEYVNKNAGKLKLAGDIFTDENFGIAVCNKKPDLQKKINDALAALKADGTLKKIEDKWLPKPPQ